MKKTKSETNLIGAHLNQFGIVACDRCNKTEEFELIEQIDNGEFKHQYYVCSCGNRVKAEKTFCRDVYNFFGDEMERKWDVKEHYIDEYKGLESDSDA